MDDKVIQIAMNVILHAGNAKTLIREAANKLVNFDNDGIQELLDEANDEIIVAHKAQTDLIHKEAQGVKIEMSILFSHAQDTLMTTESEKFIIDTLYKYDQKRRG